LADGTSAANTAKPGSRAPGRGRHDTKMNAESRPLVHRLLFRGYVRWFAGGLLLAALALSCFTVVVDPYGLLRVLDIAGFNQVKPRLYNNARMVKAHYVSRAKPHGLIIGSSRADVGLDAAMAEKLGIAGPVFNSSLPSARIREVFAYLRHAHGEGRLRQAVIGLDFFMFDANSPYEAGFEPGRLALNGGDAVWLERTKDYLRAFFSYDALDAAVYTLRHQEQYAVSYLDNGGQDPRTRQRNVNDKGGHRAAFNAALRETVTSNDTVAALRYAPSSLERNGELTVFREMLRFCQREHIDLYLAMSPTHALWLQAIWELGMWPDYERWKRDLNAVVVTVRGQRESNAVLALWDFTGFSEINREEPPAKGRRDAVMRWYWEASHYKHATGDQVMFRLLGLPPSEAPADFGVRLGRNNIDAHLSALRAGRERYFADHPAATQLLWTALDGVRSQLEED
jgi:hypothetical protein